MKAYNVNFTITLRDTQAIFFRMNALIIPKFCGQENTYFS
jgi:hypothetical protein